MIRIGVTGGIGSGKSVVSSLLQIYGIPVYSADLESKKLATASMNIRKQLTALLGDSVYDSSGLDRKRMASLIFNDPELLKKVNAIIHPEVAHHFNEWVNMQHTRWVILESAILFESGFNHQVNLSLLVYTPQEIRIERAIERDKTVRTDVMQRIKNQQPDEEKKKYVDYIIYNDGKKALIPQIEDFYYYLSNR
ncbi:MAG: dephospho-CoA kinase [Tannerella sp.]|jgi:dephospho-CoA kinase|nr:dephospho-CoA kinase [Tannerella sp.]